MGKEPKFIQIAAATEGYSPEFNSALFALDEEGQVWEYGPFTVSEHEEAFGWRPLRTLRKKS